MTSDSQFYRSARQVEAKEEKVKEGGGASEINNFMVDRLLTRGIDQFNAL